MEADVVPVWVSVMEADVVPLWVSVTLSEVVAVGAWAWTPSSGLLLMEGHTDNPINMTNRDQHICLLFKSLIVFLFCFTILLHSSFHYYRINAVRKWIDATRS